MPAAGSRYITCQGCTGMVASLSAAEAKQDRSADPPPYLQLFDGLEKCARSIEDMLGGDSGAQISMLVLVSDEGIVEAIQRAGPGVRIEKTGGNPPNTAVSLEVTGGSKDRSGRLLVVQAGAPRIYLALTHEGSSFANTLPSVLERMYPYAFVARFSSGEMLSMLEQSESKTGLLLTAKRITARSRAAKKAARARTGAEGPEAGAGRREPGAAHAGASYREVIESALEGDQRIDRVHFFLSEGRSVRLEGQFSRSGLFKFRRSFMIFKEHALPSVLDMCSEKVRLYSSRSREDNGGDTLPIVIRIESDVFRDRDQHRRFIDAVLGMKHASSGVYVASPYVDMSLVDHIDGSTFEIFVMSPDKITIVPQARTTTASVSRLVDHIFERFQEGKVFDYG